jgi:hypothetical protein
MPAICVLCDGVREGARNFGLNVRVADSPRRSAIRLRFFENRVLRRIFVSKRDDVTGEWRRLHNEELRVLYSSPNIFG